MAATSTAGDSYREFVAADDAALREADVIAAGHTSSSASCAISSLRCNGAHHDRGSVGPTEHSSPPALGCYLPVASSG